MGLTIDELGKQVHDLRELLDKKSDGEREKEREDELLKKIMDKVHPPKRKMIWVTPDQKAKEDEKGFYLGQFLKAILPANAGRYPEIMNSIAKTADTIMTEGEPAQGGYVVPTEYSDQIILLEAAESILAKLAFNFPMGKAPVRNVPQQLTDVTITWTEEVTPKTLTKPTLSRVVQTAKKAAAIVKLADELLEDNSVGLDKIIMMLIAREMGAEFDRCGFVGNADPFTGVSNAVGVNAIAQVGADLAGDDIINLIFGIGAAYRKGATLVTSSHGLRLIMQLKDANGQYLWQQPSGNQPAKIWTYPYEVSDEILSTYGGGTETAILFGNWGKYLLYSPKGPYEVKSTISGADFATSTSAFMNDETWYRFKRRISIDVGLPVAFSRMLVK